MGNPHDSHRLAGAKKALYAFVTAFIILSAGEIVLSILGTFPAEKLYEKKRSSASWQENLFAAFMGIHQPDPLLLWKMRPNLNKSYMQTNARGLTGPLIAHHKDTAKLRILVLGDSTPLGIGLDRWNKAFPWRLQEWLSEQQGHPSEIINASTAGYSTLQGLIYLKNEGLKYQPDIVLIYLGNNDASYNGYISDSALCVQAGQYLGLKKFLNHFRLYRFLKSVLMPLKVDRQMPADEILQVRVSENSFEKNLTEIIRLCQANGSKIILNTIPVPLTWPPGVEFKVFTTGRDSLSGQLFMPASQRKMLESKFSLALDLQMFASQFGHIDPWSQRVLSSAYSDSGNISENIRQYQALTVKDSQDAGLWNNLGVLFWKENNFDSARYCLGRADSLQPNSPNILYNLGMTYLKLGMPDSAQACLGLARDLDFNSLRIKTPYNNIIRALALQNKIPLLDLEELFDRLPDRDRLFVDHCHPNLEGHHIIARALGTKILEILAKSN